MEAEAKNYLSVGFDLRPVALGAMSANRSSRMGAARCAPGRRDRSLHGEDDTELGFTAGHAVVGFVDFVQGEFFDHGADAGVLSEAEGVFGVGGRAGSPALDALGAHDELRWGWLDGIRACADHEERAVLGEAVHEGGHGFGTGCGGKDKVGAAEFLKLLGRVGGGAVDINMRAELSGESFAVFSTADGGDLIAELVGELNAEVAEAANSENGCEITGLCAAVAE
jgi:hypothetical protein